MAKNKNLHSAKKEKNDEFYTQLTDIEKELKHYKHHFKDKVVFCNCDDPEWSNFWKFFSLQFEKLGLKKLMATHYETEKQSYYLEMWKDDSGVHSGIRTLRQNGDFRSPECIELLKQADIVVTNPPFSLFREYVSQLIEYDKKFIIIGNKNIITYKEIFPLIKDDLMWVGAKQMSGSLWFGTPEGYETPNDKIINGVKLTPIACCWFTNLDIKKRHEDIILFKKYYDDPAQYPKYDNYDAINVDKVTDIPCDYEPCWYKCELANICPYALNEGTKDSVALCECPTSSNTSQKKCNGAMAVPITFVDKYNPEQFTILNANGLRTNESIPIKPHGLIKDKEAVISIKNFDTIIKEITAENLQQQRTCNSREQHTPESVSGRKKCNGIIGVPITFLDKYNPEQFRIITMSTMSGKSANYWSMVNGSSKYSRIFIRKT